MQKVAFLTPNNEKFEMNYWEVEEFCKKICLKEAEMENIKYSKKQQNTVHKFFTIIISTHS